MRNQKLKRLVASALLVALHVVLSRFCSINAWNMKIGFSFVPVFAAAYRYGSSAAALVAGAGDVLGAVLFPIGPYFPGFTLTGILGGLLFGALLHKKQSALRIVCAAAVDQLVLGLLLNTFWISLLYGTPYVPLLETRALQCAVMLAIEFPSVSFLSRALPRCCKGVFV